MRKQRATGYQFDREDFELLLSWLDPDRERAAHKYEEIRARLIKIFHSRGSSEAEYLADETIDRVLLKIKNLKENFVGNPALYFYGVAKNVYYESLRSNKKKVAALQSLPAESEIKETRAETDCLDRCLSQLSAEQRDLILEYYEDENEPKLKRREELARKIKVTVNLLRVKVYRVKKTLQNCLVHCLDEKSR